MDYEAFEARLNEKLSEVKLESSSVIGSAFNTGLMTMLNIAVTEYIRMYREGAKSE